jgi:hypothetical protein
MARLQLREGWQMDKRFVSWAAALREGDFASIADWFIRYFFTVGALVLLLSGIAVGVDKGLAAGLRVFVLSSLFAAASTVSGWLLGLLFGVPRTLARGQIGSVAPRPNDSAATQPNQAQAPPAATSRVNTNLEDISDWLTKTIVGVGLTELFRMPGYFWHVAGELNTHGFAWEPYGRLLALGLFFYFAPGGFWLGYVGTRTILTKLFELIETSTSELVTLAEDENSKRLKKFIWPNGPEGPENNDNLDKIRQWMTANVRAGIPVATFLNTREFADARKKAVGDLNVPQAEEN